MIDLDLLVTAKRTELTNLFPQFTHEQLRDMRTAEMRRRNHRDYRQREKEAMDPRIDDRRRYESARRGSERLRVAIFRHLTGQVA